MAAHEGSNIADTDTNAGTSGGQFVSPAGGAAITVDEQSAEDEPKSEGKKILSYLLHGKMKSAMYVGCLCVCLCICLCIIQNLSEFVRLLALRVLEISK